MAPLILPSFVFLLVTAGAIFSQTEELDSHTPNAEVAGHCCPTSTCQALVSRLDTLEQIVTTLRRQLQERDTHLDHLRDMLLDQNAESISLRKQVVLLQLQHTSAKSRENGKPELSTEEKQENIQQQPNHHEDNSYPVTKQANFGPLEEEDAAALRDPARQGGVINSEAQASRRSDDGGPLEATVSQLSQRVALMNADLLALQNSDRQHSQDILTARQSLFVRWGNSQCTYFSQLVYSGVAGGSHYTESGAATNFLCLPLNPVFGPSKPWVGAHLYGAEYETGDSHLNKNAVCAVCRAPLATTVMIPGTNVCTPGWIVQYSGYLMAGSASQTGTEYVCVDFAMGNSMSGNANEDGKLFYYTSTRCGSLPCDPYVNDQIVLCVVCSK